MKIIGIDPGSTVSGFIILTGDEINQADNVINDFLFDRIQAEIRPGTVVVIEDVAPYSGRLKPQVIETCKFIGELVYRLKTAGIQHELHPRSAVKKWLFDSCPAIVIPRIEAKILKKGRLTKSGEPFKPTFIWVDDRIVIAGLKELWGIETPKPGKKNRFGITKHAWSALALASYWRSML